MHKIGLTGVTGHVGNGVYQKLRDAGIAYKLLMRKPLDEFADDEVVIGDLTQAEKLSEFAKGCTAIIHCAGMVWPRIGRNPEVLKVNVDGTKRLFEKCKKNGVQHFVYVSSIHSMDNPSQAEVFDETARLTIDESKPYDFSKAEVERFLLKQEGIKITIINPTAIIGPGDQNLRAMNQLFYLLYKGQLPWVTAGGFHVVDVRTVAEALLNAILLDKTGKYIVGGNPYSIKALAALYGKVNQINGKRLAIYSEFMRMIAFGLKPIEYLVKKPLPLNSYAVETLLNAHPNISSERAFADLDLSPIPMEKTLVDLHEWFKNGLNKPY